MRRGFSRILALRVRNAIPILICNTGMLLAVYIDWRRHRWPEVIKTLLPRLATVLRSIWAISWLPGSCAP